MNNIVNNKFGRLTVLKQISYYRIICLCECGKNTNVTYSHLLRGNTKSCGCLHIERIKEANTIHGESVPITKEYEAHSGMMQRCYNSKKKQYKNYGGRGIMVCKRWHNYNNFLTDMGRAPSKYHSIDRINNDGNYTPKNCRWATQSEQNRNKSNTKMNKYIVQYIRERKAKRSIIIGELNGICSIANYKAIQQKRTWKHI